MAQVKQNQVEQAGATDRVYRIAELYKTSVAPALMAKFGYKNVNEVPRLVKIVLNMGLGDVKDNTKSFELAVAELRDIAGQAPAITKAKKSIANFKLREGMKIGAKVTLRGKRMYDFFDKLVSGSASPPRCRSPAGRCNLPHTSRTGSPHKTGETTAQRQYSLYPPGRPGGPTPAGSGRSSSRWTGTHFARGSSPQPIRQSS